MSDDLQFAIEALDRSRHPPQPPHSDNMVDDRLCYCAVCDMFFISRQNLVMHWNRQGCRDRSARVANALTQLSRAQHAALMSRYSDL